MKSTRRAMIGGAGAAAVGLGIGQARALVQDRFQALMRTVMAKTWIGQSRTRNDRFEGGDLVTAIGMKFDLNSDWTYEGAMLESLNYNGGIYKGFYKISGECWTIGDDAGVSIYRSELIEADALPQGFGWSIYRGDFRFYNDSNRKGHFTLQGILSDAQDGTQSRVNLIDAEG